MVFKLCDDTQSKRKMGAKEQSRTFEIIHKVHRTLPITINIPNPYFQS